MSALDKRKEHRELRALELLEQPTEDVVVVEKVPAPFYLALLKRLLQVVEERVELLQQHRPWTRWADLGNALYDL